MIPSIWRCCDHYSFIDLQLCVLAEVSAYPDFGLEPPNSAACFGNSEATVASISMLVWRGKGLQRWNLSCSISLSTVPFTVTLGFWYGFPVLDLLMLRPKLPHTAESLRTHICIFDSLMASILYQHFFFTPRRPSVSYS